MVRSRKIRRILERKKSSTRWGRDLEYVVLEVSLWVIALGLASAYWANAALAEGQPNHWYYAGACALGSALCWVFRKLT